MDCMALYKWIRWLYFHGLGGSATVEYSGYNLIKKGELNYEKKLLTKRQNEVMSVLWGSDLPLSANQICNENESLNMNTVQQVLKALLKMQFIKVEDIGYSNTVLTRLYSPVVKQADYLQFLLGNNSTFDLTSSLIDRNKNLNELKQLQVLIEKKCKELEE